MMVDALVNNVWELLVSTLWKQWVRESRGVESCLYCRIENARLLRCSCSSRFSIRPLASHFSCIDIDILSSWGVVSDVLIQGLSFIAWPSSSYSFLCIFWKLCLRYRSINNIVCKTHYGKLKSHVQWLIMFKKEKKLCDWCFVFHWAFQVLTLSKCIPALI